MKLRVLFILVITVYLNSIAWALSDRLFTDKVANYQIMLLGDWQQVSYTDAVGRRKTEFVFHSRREGLLTIAKERPAGRSLQDKVHLDLSDMRLNYACVFSSEEPFSGGQLSGIRVALYFLQDVRKVAATYYYLQDADSVWVLRFTGEPGSTGVSQETTDRMARSFCSVCPLL